MSLAISFNSEMLKTRRTAAFWMSVAGAAFIPCIFLLIYLTKPDKMIPKLELGGWTMHLQMGWQSLSSFLFPMYVILICALIPQVEYRNNAWKQVWASPQTTGEVFFAKWGAIQSMILLFFVVFNGLMIGNAALVNIINPKFPFFHMALDWKALIHLNVKTFVSVLSISAFQYWLSLRFKSFVAPVGIGLALLIAGLIATGFGWEHVDKIPFAYPILTLKSMMMPKQDYLVKHEWYSLAYTALFLVLGFLDLRYRKERG
ncbi:hypothetical protein EPD60_03815 [Flaviaesturariibacter flavus]|uniref:ABC transporter permease n=1 Tax=Flaviaesturariibacter flavus TaxID=2502780 RepID=A0A4R1BMQ1_9BACT|nr:ABC transporter permease [Flaviaesturariibacter flavus]TCJ18636.1 hypothetical protein EPD60_03815 [Flaviaesturariibacter flavus]